MVKKSEKRLSKLELNVISKRIGEIGEMFKLHDLTDYEHAELMKELDALDKKLTISRRLARMDEMGLKLIINKKYKKPRGVELPKVFGFEVISS